MKKHLVLFVLITLPGLVDAQKKKIFFYELDLINNLFFQPNTIAPFTGLAYDEYPNGKKKMHVPIKDGKLHGTVSEWEKNGQKVYEAQYEMGVQTGVEKQWYATGTPKLVIPYVNGRAEGTCTEWFKNGNKKSEGLYANGKEEGEHLWWHPTGELDQQVHYKNGLVQGTVFNWYRNGQVKLEKEFKNGLEDGTTTEHYENGQVQSVGQFKAGQPHGEARFWSKKGQLLGIQHFEHGKLIKDFNYRSGSIHVEGGYLQVFNEMESFFTVSITGEEVFPRKSKEIVYVVDGMLLQLINNSLELFIVGKKTGLTEKEFLTEFQRQETAYIKEKTEFDIQVDTNWFTIASGQQAIHWSFVSPSSKDPEQKPRTVQEEHYVSLVCNQQILNLYGIVTNSDDSRKVVAMLKRIADTVRIWPDRIDLNSIAQKTN